MKRNRLISGSIAVIGLTLGACGSSGPKTLSADDFITQLNAICRTANSAIGALDTNSKSYVTDIVGILSTGRDSLAKLTSPKSLKVDYADFEDNIDSQLAQAQKLAKAVQANDKTAAQAASDKVGKLALAADKLATSMGASRCVGVGGAGSGNTVSTDSPTVQSAAPETTVAATTATTVAATTTTTATTATTIAVTTTTDAASVGTPLPIDTSGVVTTAPSNVVAVEASLHWTAPPTYTWAPAGTVKVASTPSNDPVLGPILRAYYSGALVTKDGTNIGIYITQLTQNSDWTPGQLVAYDAFESLTGAPDAKTPGGIPVKYIQKVDAGEGLSIDVADFVVPGAGVLVVGPTGTDLLGALDAFYTANTMAG